MGYINRTKVLQAVAGNSKQIQLRTTLHGPKIAFSCPLVEPLKV